MHSNTTTHKLQGSLQSLLFTATEIVYCILSLTAKLYLGLFILINVIMADASANDTLSGAGAESRR